MNSCIGLIAESKFDLYIHPTDDELLLHPRQHASGDSLPSNVSI